MATMTGDQSANVSGTKYIDSRCIVEFRPDDNWKGEYGFDWFRRGDTKENINGSISQSNYKPIVGKYAPHDPDYGDDGTLQVDKSGGKPEKSYYAYRLAREEYPVFKIKGIDRIYIAPYISLFFASTKQGENRLPMQMLYKNENGGYSKHDFCKVKATVKLLIEAKNIKSIEFVCDDELSVSPKTISTVPDGQSSDQKLSIRFNYMFNGDGHKAIKVFAYHKDGVTKTFAGQLNVVRCKPKAVDVCFVNVKISRGYNVSSGFADTDFIDEQKKNLRRFFAQAHIIPNITTADLDLDRSDLDGFFKSFPSKRGYTTFESIMVEGVNGNAFFPQKLEQLFGRPDVYKVFFLGEKGCFWDGEYVGLAGIAKDIPSKTLVIYENPDESVVCHEILHCFGLWHSFSNNSNHTFEKYKTSNIMDYSTDTYTLWRWQWNKIRNDADGTELVQ